MSKTRKLFQLRNDINKIKERISELEKFGNRVVSSHDLRNGYDCHWHLKHLPNSIDYCNREILKLSKNQLNIFFN